MNPSLPSSSEESLLNRSKATLNGEDPVIKLLDNRMRDIFRLLVISNPQKRQQAPSSLRTGRSLSTGEAPNNESNDSLFKEAAKQEFTVNGFAFYSNELAEASLLASRTINLVIATCGRYALHPLFSKIGREH